MKKYNSPIIEISDLYLNDVLSVSNGYNGSSWHDNETPLIPFNWS